MRLRPFGRTDLKVSELCLGTMHFGWKTDETASAAILDRYVRAGGNFLQAASSTSSEPGVDLLATALSEEHVGRWMRARGIARDELVLATRVVLPRDAADRSKLNGLVRASCEGSLRRLHVDHLDVLLVEWSAALVSVEHLLEALWHVVRDGLVRYTGASGFPAWRIMQAQSCASWRALPRFEAVQHDMSLLERRAFESDLGTLCTETRTAFLARSPLAGGFLVNGPRRRTWSPVAREQRLRERFQNRCSLGMRDTLHAVANGRGSTAAQTGIMWVLAQPAVTAAVVGVTSPAQLSDLIEAAGQRLSSDEARLLADSRPGEATMAEGARTR